MATFACTECIAVVTQKNSRSRMTKKTWFFGVPAKQMLSNFVSSKQRKLLSLRKRFASRRCPLRLQPAIFSSLLRAICKRLAVTHVTRSQVQAHANLGHVFDAEDEPCPETRCNQWTSTQDLTDMAMALLCQYQQGNFSPPMRLQFLWKDGREILALKASFRIRLVMVWNHVESACNESASNSQKPEQGAHLGLLCRYKRERTKTRRSSRWSLCRKVCICLKEPLREIKQLLVKRATVRVSTCVRHSCMCKEPKDSAFEVSAKMCRPVSHGPRYRAHLCKMPECSRLNA